METLTTAREIIHAETRRAAKLRGSLCRLVGATGRRNRPISTVYYEIVEGDVAPSYEGHSYHFENKSGDIIRFPNAYRRAYGKPIYCPARHRITVGAEWLLGNADKLV